MLRIGIAGGNRLSNIEREFALAPEIRSGMPFFLDEDQTLADELNSYLESVERRGLQTSAGLRQHAREIQRWAAFLDAVQGKPLWTACAYDLHAYHQLLTANGCRTGKRAWNAGSAALMKLYHWAELNHLYRSDIEFRDNLARRYHIPAK
jgi:hypothetical protein